MLKHYILIASRNFKRDLPSFAINLFGLSAGLTCTLLICLWVNDELQMDQFNRNDDRIFQVMEHQQYADQINTTTSTPGLLAEALKEDFPEIEKATTITWVTDYDVSVDEKILNAKGIDVGIDFFEILGYPIIQGVATDVLVDKASIVVSEELAAKFFEPGENILGKQLLLQHNQVVQISGVFRKVQNSSLQFDFALSYEAFKEQNDWLKSWGSNGPSTLVKLHDGSNENAVSEKIKDYVKQKTENSNVTLFLQKYSNRYLYGQFENGKAVGGRIEYVKLFIIVAFIILVIACVNFMNLSTAQAARKGKEVGIKKSVGADRNSLLVQYFTETMMVSFLASIIAVIVASLFMPLFNNITSKHIVMPMREPIVLLGMAAIALFTGLLAGSYPALFLSGFKPTDALRGNIKGSTGEFVSRKGLVIFQFSVSVILITAVLVLYKQIEFTQRKNIGYDRKNLIQLPMVGKLRSNSETFIQEVQKIPGVLGASSLGHNLVGRNNNTRDVEWPGKYPDYDILFEQAQMNYDGFELMGFDLLEGRTFSRQFAPDTSSIIFNQAAIDAMNLKDPVGASIKLHGQPRTIIGIVRDFNFQSLHTTVAPLFMIYNEGGTWNVMIRLDERGKQETIQKLSEFYSTFNPGFTFDYKFQDDEYALQYSAEQRVATLAGYFAAFAVLISCLGLYGLAAHTTERRFKEMGIRKALGSSTVNILFLLSRDFIKLVMFGIGLGLPVSYWLMNKWLQRFAFHIDFTIWFLLVAAIIALLIALFAVASKAWSATRINPVNCIRME